MSLIDDICTELAGVAEPTATKRDDSRMRPTLDTLDADRLYLWCPRVLVSADDTRGFADLLRCEVHLAWASDKAGEGEPDPVVSAAIHARALALLAALQAHHGAAYEQIESFGIQFDAIAGLDVRGFEMTLLLYQKPGASL